MLTPAGRYRIFAYAKPLDFRCGIDRIAHVCKSELSMNPYGGAVFLFFNRNRDRVKIFFYDGAGEGSGPCLFLKRLDRGRFKHPRAEAGQTHAEIPASDLALLLEGVDVTKIPRPKQLGPLPKEVAKDKKPRPLAFESPDAP
jgi:transposase